MFFHTTTELEIAEIYGIADSTGINLISNDHPFPYLVEQEERYHGALLSQTTCGALFLLFDSFSLRAYDEFSFKLKVPKEFSFEPLAAYNDFRYFRRKILDGSLEASESIAKYLAYLAQSREIRGWPKALEELFNKDKQQYPTLDRIAAIIGEPVWSEDYYAIKHFTVYIIGKWSFNTAGLTTLYSCTSFKDLKVCIESESFIDPKSSADRLGSSLDLLENNTINYKEIWLRHKTNSTQQNSLLYGNDYGATLFKNLTEKLSPMGYTSEPLASAQDLSAKAVTIGARIESMAWGLFHHLFKDHVQLEYSNEWIIHNQSLPDIKYLSSILHYDPAFKVNYEIRYSLNTSWLELHNKAELEAAIDFKVGSCIVYLSTNEEKGITAHFIIEGYTQDVIGSQEYRCLRLTADKT